MHHSITDEGIHLFAWQQGAGRTRCLHVCLLCQVNSFEVYWDIQIAVRAASLWCSAIAMLLCFIVYGSTAVFGYLDFGNRATVSALLLYNPVKEPEVMVAYIGLLVKLCASFPLISMATRNSLYHSVGWDPDKLPFWKHCVVVVSLAVAALLFGLFIPSINMVFGFIGSFCGGATGFLLPSILMMYGGNWSLRSVGWGALHHHIRAALCRCRHGGVLAQVPPSTALWRETECGAVWSSGHDCASMDASKRAVCFCRTLLRYWAHWVQCEAGRALTIKTHLFPVPYTSVAERLCPFSGLFMF
ncbi:putative amino acid transporter [Trypanosoma cruzi]|uniref:Putative amino acid transporter n=1 Tax=Trypanosoma cruzi TaxID=5693 RepID=A0A2V2V490_TRYCR|nr:putative amino acid transporter [Trypanosoma cruzi]